jgi:hypothetical protein
MQSKTWQYYSILCGLEAMGFKGSNLKDSRLTAEKTGDWLDGGKTGETPRVLEF